jgi:hypothetical protein
VKSDAMTIRKSDIDKAKALIGFSSDIGGWRVSKTPTSFKHYEVIEALKNERLNTLNKEFWLQIKATSKEIDAQVALRKEKKYNKQEMDRLNILSKEFSSQIKTTLKILMPKKH